MSRTVKHLPRTPQGMGAARAPAVLLTAEQLMERLGVSRTSLWSLMRKRGLPYIKLGPGRRAALRFSVESVNTWLTQNEQRDAP